MLSVTLIPTGPGAYTEWSFLSGAPTHWQAAASETDSSFAGSATNGQRDAYAVTFPPELRPDDTVLTFNLYGWLQWRGSALGGAARTMAFYRIGSTDIDAAEWIVNSFDPLDPTIPGPVIAMPPIPLTLAVGQFYGQPFQLGVRRTNARGVNLHALRAVLSVRPRSDSMGFVGGFR